MGTLIPPQTAVRLLSIVLVGDAVQRLSVPGSPRWELTPRGRPDEAEAEREFYGYGVDSGTAAFLDASAAPWLCRLADDGYGPLLTKLDGKLRDPATGPNVVAFESG